MRILIAEDENIGLKLLESKLSKWGHDIILTRNGKEAWDAFLNNDVNFAILDWIMPQMDGLEVCRKIRNHGNLRYVYIIILTVKSEKQDIVEGLEAGADDYIAKPFNTQELFARIKVGERILGLESSLKQNISELEESFSHIKKLQGLLPICAWCKKIKDKRNDWQRIEKYIEEHTEAMFTHSICDECKKKHFSEFHSQM